MGDRVELEMRERMRAPDVRGHLPGGVRRLRAGADRAPARGDAEGDRHPEHLLRARGLRRDLGRFSPGGWLGRRLERADALLYEEIARRRRAPDLDERTDVLSLLLRARDEDGEPMTDVELRDELWTMLGAGHETTATGLAWAFDLLLHNPEVLARRARRSRTGTTRTWMRWSTETLRIRPVIDAAERTLKAPRTVAGWELPGGSASIRGSRCPPARGPLPRAGRFRPERFIEERAESYTWLPFGGGIRRCIGAGAGAGRDGRGAARRSSRGSSSSPFARSPSRWCCGGSRSRPGTAPRCA